MKFLYKYPQTEFPYEELVSANQSRGRDLDEFEILDTQAFAEDRYWDVFVEVIQLIIRCDYEALTSYAVCER
jgi:hypothetical protein